MAPSPPVSHRRRRAVRFAVVIAGFLAALAVAEIVLRLAGYPGELDQQWLLAPAHERDRVFDPGTLLARPVFYDERHYRVEPGQRIVVALGDSFTQGFHIADADGYVACLQRHLDEAGIDAAVVNMGMGYAGHDQHLAILERFVLPRLTPDVVVWQLCYNDFRDDIDLSVYRIDDGRLVPHGVDGNWLYVRERLYQAMPRVAAESFVCRLVLDLTKRLRAREVPALYQDDVLAYARTKAARIVARMLDLSHQHGFRLVVAVIEPQAVSLLAEGATPDKSTAWCIASFEAQRALLSGIDDFVDTRFDPVDLAAVDARFSTSVHSVAEGLFLTGEVDPAALGIRHYNAYGNWLFAQKIGQYLAAHRDRLFD